MAMLYGFRRLDFDQSSNIKINLDRYTVEPRQCLLDGKVTVKQKSHAFFSGLPRVSDKT
jgi:hypothetical protein